MDRAAFLKILAARLYPVLRADGFSGSGLTLRRIDLPVIHVFNVQGSQSAPHCYLNMGAHLWTLEDEADREDPKKLLESSCLFRERLDPAAGAPFGWPYGDSVEEAEETVAFIVSEYERVGRAFYARYARFPESFDRLVSETDPASLHPAWARDYARIAAKLGRADRVVAFADAGLATVAERATGLKADLLALRAQPLAGHDRTSA